MDYTYARIHLVDGSSVTLRSSVTEAMHALEDTPIRLANWDDRPVVVYGQHVTCIVGLTQDEMDQEAEGLRLQNEAAEELRQAYGSEPA